MAEDFAGTDGERCPERLWGGTKVTVQGLLF